MPKIGLNQWQEVLNRVFLISNYLYKIDDMQTEGVKHYVYLAV